MGKEISATCSSGSKTGRCIAWSAMMHLKRCICLVCLLELASGIELESPCSTKQKYMKTSADSRIVLRIFAANSTAWWCKATLKPFQLPSASKITSISSQVYIRLSFSYFPVTMESYISWNGLAFKKKKTEFLQQLILLHYETEFQDNTAYLV